VTASAQVNRAGLDALLADPAVHAAQVHLAELIVAAGRGNIVAMGAVDTGRLRRSGRVETPGDEVLAGFDTPYAHVVHDGLGTGRNDPPRPYLTAASHRNRGQL
jgi:hypothetical protein